MKLSSKIKAFSVTGVVALLAVVVYCGFQLPHINTRYSVRQFFPKDHPALKNDDTMEKTFQLRSSPAFFVTMELKETESGTWLQPARMANLKSVSDDLSALPGVKDVVSIANVEMAVQSKTDLRIGNLQDTMPAWRWSDYVSKQPLLTPQLIAGDRRSVLLAIEPNVQDASDLGPLEMKIRGVLAREDKIATYGIAGVPAVQSHLTEKLQSEVGRFLILSLAIFILMFMAFYKNAAPVVFAAVGLAVSNVCVIGVLAILSHPFTVLLSTLPIILSITFVSLAVHTLHLWADRLNEKGNPTDIGVRWKLSLEVLHEILLPNFLGSLTTAIGFATLATTTIPMIKDYALTVAASVMVVLLLAQILFVLTLPWFTPVQRAWTRQRAWWTTFITRKAAPIFICIVAGTVFLGGAVMKLNFSTKLFDDLPKNESVNEAMGHIDDNFGGTVNLDIGIDAGHNNAWLDPSGLRQLKSAIKEIRVIPGVGTALGVTDFLGDKVPATSKGVSEMMFMYSMSPSNPMLHFVDNNMRETRIALRLEDLTSSKVERIRSEVRRIVAEKLPQATVIESGLAVNNHVINNEVARDLVYGFWQSLLIIGLLLAVIFRSIRWALVACLPNMVTPAVLVGVLAFLQTPIKPAVALIFSIALGLAFNNTVYLLSRLRRMKDLKSLSILPLRRALLEEGNPCLSESLLMFAGFLIFLSSDFQLNKTFGAYMILAIVAGALGDLVFLPAVLKLFPELIMSVPRTLARIPVKVQTKLVEVKRKNRWFMIAAGLLFAGSFVIPAQARADEAKDILKKAQQSLEAKSDQATVTLKIIEANGDVKERKIVLKAMHDGSTYHAKARILAPADVKGTALLAEIKDGKESQWLYLPSSHQVRRIVSGTKSQGILGSELNPDDMNSAVLEGASAKLIKKDATHAWIDVAPNASNAGNFDKASITLSMPAALPEKMEYSLKGKVIKTVEFKNYITVNKVERAQLIVVKNLTNNRGTEVQLSDIKVNSGVSAADFTQSALKNE